MKTRKKIEYFALAAAGLSMASLAQAFPGLAVNTGNSCSACHGRLIADQPEGVALSMTLDGAEIEGIMAVHDTGLLTDLGTQLDGKTRGEVKTFQTFPGEVASLQIDVLEGVNATNPFAVQIKRLEKPGQKNSADNFLDWSEANGPENVWSRQEADNPPYFTKGIFEGFEAGNPGTLNFDLLVGETTPPDVYDLEYAMAGHNETQDTLFYEDEHFYLEVLAPGTNAILAKAVDLGDDWKFSPWFGTYNISLDPWIFHTRHGFIYVFQDSTPSSLFYYDAGIGSWVFTSEETYPNLFLFNGMGWVFFFDEDAETRSFFQFSTGEFIFFDRG